VTVGCPASGKGTLCSRLAKEYPVAHLSVGDFLRRTAEDSLPEDSTAVCSALDRQELLAPEVLLPLLRIEFQRLKGEARNNGNRAVLIDGFPRNSQQMDAFVEKVSSFSRLVLAEQMD
jgi:UMP-CMP kinase